MPPPKRETARAAAKARKPLRWYLKGYTPSARAAQAILKLSQLERASKPVLAEKIMAVANEFRAVLVFEERNHVKARSYAVSAQRVETDRVLRVHRCELTIYSTFVAGWRRTPFDDQNLKHKKGSKVKMSRHIFLPRLLGLVYENIESGRDVFKPGQLAVLKKKSKTQEKAFEIKPFTIAREKVPWARLIRDASRGKARAGASATGKKATRRGALLEEKAFKRRLDKSFYEPGKQVGCRADPLGPPGGDDDADSESSQSDSYWEEGDAAEQSEEEEEEEDEEEDEKGGSEDDDNDYSRPKTRSSTKFGQSSRQSGLPSSSNARSKTSKMPSKKTYSQQPKRSRVSDSEEETAKPVAKAARSEGQPRGSLKAQSSRAPTSQSLNKEEFTSLFPDRAKLSLPQGPRAPATPDRAAPSSSFSPTTRAAIAAGFSPSNRGQYICWAPFLKPVSPALAPARSPVHNPAPVPKKWTLADFAASAAELDED